MIYIFFSLSFGQINGKKQQCFLICLILQNIINNIIRSVQKTHTYPHNIINIWPTLPPRGASCHFGGWRGQHKFINIQFGKKQESELNWIVGRGMEDIKATTMRVSILLQENILFKISFTQSYEKLTFWSRCVLFSSASLHAWLIFLKKKKSLNSYSRKTQ